MRNPKGQKTVLAWRLGTWERAVILAWTPYNRHSPAEHVGDHFVVEFEDGHRTCRYREEVIGW